MARTFTARTGEQALDWLRAEAQDGDTVQLVDRAAGVYTKLAVESVAIGLGLDVVVEQRITRTLTGRDR